MKKLLVATQNPGKVLEYKEILKEIPIEVVTLQDIGINEEAPEDAPTFAENAKLKVDFYSKYVDYPTIAEDSGLEIDFL
ncbi:MAG: dITP/XTP pyrophosphatase, partial [Parcubacteria group bacterium Gr01-1014_19]